MPNEYLFSKTSKTGFMHKDNNQIKRGELIPLRRQNSCFKSGSTRFSIVQAHAPNTNVKTTMCGGFLFSKDNAKPNFSPVSDKRLDLRKLCCMEKLFSFAYSLYSAPGSQQQIKQPWQASAHQDTAMSRKNPCCEGGVFLTWLWFLKWQLRKKIQFSLTALPKQVDFVFPINTSAMNNCWAEKEFVQDSL